MSSRMIAVVKDHKDVRPGDYLVGGIVVSQRFSGSGKSVWYTFRSIATGEVKEWPRESTLARTMVFELTPEFQDWGHGVNTPMGPDCDGEFRFLERLPHATVFACKCGRHLVAQDDEEAAERAMAALADALVERADEIEAGLQ
jgi:hypothetical protein